MAESKDAEQCYQEIRERLLMAINSGIIKTIDMDQSKWEQILCLIENREKYTENYLFKLQEEADQIKGKLGEKNVIWGCGTYGMQALDFMKKYGYKCVALTDNNSKLWGKKISGVEIKEPSNILNENEKITYIVANKLHANEIAEQLKENGVQEQDIVLWKQ